MSQDNTQQPFSTQTDQLVPSTPTAAPTPSAALKEQEPNQPDIAKEAKIMTEIRTTAEARDAQELKEVQELIRGARLAEPQPVIPPVVQDVGVKNPQAEADQVVELGTTLVLPIGEDSYQKGLHLKVAGAVRDGVVYGVASLSALAMWATRIIQMAHQHMMKVVFRKETKQTSS